MPAVRFTIGPIFKQRSAIPRSRSGRRIQVGVSRILHGGRAAYPQDTTYLRRFFVRRLTFASFRTVAVLLVATMTLVACGGGGGGHSVTPSVPASALPSVAPGSAFTTQQSGSIALPSGVAMPMASLTVANSLGS